MTHQRTGILVLVASLLVSCDSPMGNSDSTEYIELVARQPTTAGNESVEIAEYFFYGCVHCFTLEPHIRQWLETKPDYIHFVRIPVVWNDPIQRLFAQAYYVAEEFSKVEEIHPSIFRELHVNDNFEGMHKEEHLARFFADFGIAEQDFLSAIDSPDILAKVELAADSGRKGLVSSTPTIIVNGRFLTNSVMTGSHERTIEVISELGDREWARLNGEDPAVPSGNADRKTVSQ